jgi:hypothetical protein
MDQSVTSCQTTPEPALLTALLTLPTFSWPIQAWLPCVKNQSSRGTCTAFATTSAAEIVLKRIYHKNINLSEQGLYNQGKLFWPLNDSYSDGYNSIIYLEKSLNQDYRIPLESMWKYNNSASRVIENHQYKESCKNYDQYCSNTTHQGNLICAESPDHFYECGYRTQISNFESGAKVTSYQPLWNPLDPARSLENTRLTLQQGFPVIIETGITAAFFRPTRGVILPDNTNMGSHAMTLVAYIPNDQLKLLSAQIDQLNNANLVNMINKMPTEIFQGTEGYFVVLNSWGPYWGDFGYAYLSESYVSNYASALLAVREVDLKE